MLSIFGVSIVLYYIVQMYHIKFPQCSLPIHSADEAGGGGEALFGGGGGWGLISIHFPDVHEIVERIIFFLYHYI
jgi:hypothetical protein